MVIDTASPAILAVILEVFPQCEVRRVPPPRDVEAAIMKDLPDTDVQTHLEPRPAL